MATLKGFLLGEHCVMAHILVTLVELKGTFTTQLEVLIEVRVSSSALQYN